MIIIRNKSQLNHYKDQLNHERIINYMTTNRGSSVKPICIYKVTFKVVRLNTPMGSKINLPDFILKSKFIVSLQDVDDGDCFWACMALASGCRRDRWKSTAKKIKESWLKHIGESGNNENSRNYTGMTIDDIIEFEKVVETRFAIHIINLHGIKNNTADYENIYVSEFKDQRVNIYLNVYKDHLSYITNFEH